MAEFRFKQEKRKQKQITYIPIDKVFLSISSQVSLKKCKSKYSYLKSKKTALIDIHQDANRSSSSSSHTCCIIEKQDLKQRKDTLFFVAVAQLVWIKDATSNLGSVRGHFDVSHRDDDRRLPRPSLAAGMTVRNFRNDSESRVFSRASERERAKDALLLPASFCAFWETRTAYRLRPRLAIGRCDNDAARLSLRELRFETHVNIVAVRDDGFEESLSSFFLPSFLSLFFFSFSSLSWNREWPRIFLSRRQRGMETMLLIRHELRHCATLMYMRVAQCL